MKNDINLTVLGVNYKKTSLDIRNKFALTSLGIKHIYQENANQWPEDFFILSTCNRTEIYTTAAEPQRLLRIFRDYNHVSDSEINEYTFVKSGEDAIRHLFRVASGIDSQILGDYEIVGQLKTAFNLAKEHKKACGITERLVGTSLKTSKEIRANTNISDGTTSISYAVIQLLKQQAQYDATKRICLMGLGKIGSLTLKNLTHYLPDNQITLINRNESKAEMLAQDYKVLTAKAYNQAEALAHNDILILATGADHPIVSREDIERSAVKLIFDLTVPSNLSADVKEIEGLTIYDIDQLSQIVNDTLDKRKNQVPLAEAIIDQNILELKEWQKRRSEYLLKNDAGQPTLMSGYSEN
jgi:glutamyl-tRNA reductase